MLLLVSSTGGNTPIEKLLDEAIFQTYVVVADFLKPETKLPPYRLIVNGIGDADVSPEALHAAQRMFAKANVPMLNPPADVLATGRAANADRLAEVPGLITAKTAAFAYERLAAEDGASVFDGSGLPLPAAAASARIPHGAAL